MIVFVQYNATYRYIVQYYEYPDDYAFENQTDRERIKSAPGILYYSTQLLHYLRLERKCYFERFISYVQLIIHRAVFV